LPDRASNIALSCPLRGTINRLRRGKTKNTPRCESRSATDQSPPLWPIPTFQASRRAPSSFREICLAFVRKFAI
jgi:hypothetical protein